MIRKALMIVGLLGFALCAAAQTRTTITASNIVSGGVKLASGQLCVTSTNTKGQPIAFGDGSEQWGTRPVCRAITNGAITATLSVPLPPGGICYRFEVSDSRGITHSYECVTWEDNDTHTFNFDTYIPPAGPQVNSGSSISKLTVQKLSVTELCTGCGDVTAAKPRRFLPAESCNGSRVTFTFGATPDANAAMQVYLNGQAILETDDYTLNGAQITLLRPCKSDDKLWANF